MVEPVDAVCIAICGPVIDEAYSAGPVLPEQGPTGWGANIDKLICGVFCKINFMNLLTSPPLLTSTCVSC